MTPIRIAIETLGSQAAMASAAGVSQQVVWNWLKRGDRCPPDRCPLIERATAGAVTVEQLRPDVAWSRIADPAWPHPAGRPVIDVARSVAAVQEAA